jgi:hypothetical protein
MAATAQPGVGWGLALSMRAFQALKNGCDALYSAQPSGGFIALRALKDGCDALYSAQPSGHFIVQVCIPAASAFRIRPLYCTGVRSSGISLQNQATLLSRCLFQRHQPSESGHFIAQVFVPAASRHGQSASSVCVCRARVQQGLDRTLLPKLCL